MSFVAVSLPGLAFADIAEGLSALDGGNVAVAASEFQAAYEAGDGDGAFYLGRLFEFGLGTDVDMTRAANLYAAGAERGSVNAMNRLGLLYLEGTTLLRDYAKAAGNFCEAAELGDVNGQLNCALMLKDGKGVEQDTTRTVAYLEGASEQGSIAAKNLLAQMLMTGDGVEADRTRALALFEETANAGNAMGLYELAKSYASPADGSEPDLIQAYSFANLAAVRNHEEARALRDQLEAGMSSEDVTVAQAMAQSWTAERISAQAADASAGDE